MFDDSTEVDIIPPTPERVAARALALAAVVCRSGLESDAGNADAEAFRQEVVDWTSSVGLETELENRERALICAPLGTLDERQAINASWDGEGMAVLAWALGRYDLPAHDQIVSSPDVGERLGFLNERARTVLWSPRLRRPEELEDYRERMFALHWRLREFSLRPEPLDFVRFARECGFGPLDITGLPLVRGDLGIDGRALMDVGEDRWRECLSIASERHRAANWLAGYEPVSRRHR